MFYSNEHYMSISNMAIFVYMATQQKKTTPRNKKKFKNDILVNWYLIVIKSKTCLFQTWKTNHFIPAEIHFFKLFIKIF